MNCKYIKNGKEYSTRTRAIRGVEILDSYDSILDRIIDNVDSEGFFFKDSFFQNESSVNITNIGFKLNNIFNKKGTLSSKRQSVRYLLDMMLDKNIRVTIKKNVQQRNKFAEDIVLDTIDSLIKNESVSNLNQDLVDLATGIIKMYHHINDDSSVISAITQSSEDKGVFIQKPEELEILDETENAIETRKVLYNNSEMNTLMRNKYGSMDIVNRFANVLRYSLMNFNSPYGTNVSLQSKDTLKDGIFSIYENLKKGILIDDNYFDGSTYQVYRNDNKEEVTIEEITKDDIVHPGTSNHAKMAYVLYNMIPSEYRTKDEKEITPEERIANEQEIMYFINSAFPKLNANDIISKRLNGEDAIHATASEKYTDQYAPEDAIPMIFQQIMGTIPMDINEPSKGFVPYSMVREIFYTLSLYKKAGRLDRKFDLKEFIGDLKNQLTGNLKDEEARMFSYRDYKRKSAEAIVAHFDRSIDLELLQEGTFDAGILWYADTENIQMMLGKNVDGEFQEGLIGKGEFSEDAEENIRIQNRLKTKFSQKSNAVRNLIKAIENVYSNINEDPISYIDESGQEQVQSYISKLRHTYEYRTNIEEYWGGRLNDNAEIGHILKNNVFGENKKVVLSLNDKGKYNDEVTIYTKEGKRETEYTIKNVIPDTEVEFKEYVDNIKEGFRRLGFANIDTFFVEYIDRLNNFESRRRKLASNSFGDRNILQVLQAVTNMAYYNYNTLERSRPLLENIMSDVDSVELMNTELMSEIESNNNLIYSEIKKIQEDEKKKATHVRSSDYGSSVLRVGSGNVVYLYNAWQDRQFFQPYIESLYNFDNYIGNIMGKTADGKFQSIINTATPYHLTTKTSNAILGSLGKEIQVDGTIVKKFQNNLINQGLIRFKDDALLDGGIEGSYQGRKQHDLSTSDFVNKMFNHDIKNALLGKSLTSASAKDNSPATMFTMTDMFGERKSMYKREWYWHGDNPLYAVSYEAGIKGNNIKSIERNENELMKAYTAIADHYALLQKEGLQILKDSGLIIEDGFIKSISMLEDGTTITEMINEKDSYRYRQLIKNHHFKTTNINGENFITQGNIFSFDNTPLPKQLMTSLIERKANYKDVIDSYILPQSIELADMLKDVKLSREFDKVLNVELAIKETSKIIEELHAKNPNLFPKNKEEFDEIIEKIKNIKLETVKIDDNIKEIEAGVYESENDILNAENSKSLLLESKLNLLNEKNALQEKVNNFKVVFAKTISKQNQSKLKSDNDVNIVLEYAINSFFLYNESISQIVKGGSTYYSNLADEIKRGMGVTSPRLAFNSKDSRGVGSGLNVIYTTDVEGEMLGIVDSEAMTNGNVLVNPLTFDRFLYTSGYEFASFNKGQIKINIFDAGYNSQDAGYIKMSAFTLRKHELNTRSQFYQDSLKAFLDKDFGIVEVNSVINNGVTSLVTEKKGNFNLFEIYGKEILNAKSDKHLFRIYKKINDDIYNKIQSGVLFTEEQIEDGIIDESTEVSLTKDIYELLPHMIAPNSAAKTFARNIIPMVNLEDDNTKFSSTLPMFTPDGVAVNNSMNMAKLSAGNLGIQGNKQHDLLSDKTIPVQILNFISAIDKDSFTNISLALSNIIEQKTGVLEELYSKGDYQKIIDLYRDKAYAGKLTQEKSFMIASLYNNKSINNDVILKDIVRSMMVDLNNINKPSLPGSSFVQVPAAYNLYFDKETGQAYYASEVGTMNDQIDDMSQDITEEQITVDEEGNEIKTSIASKGNKYDRRKLKPFSFYVNGKQVMTKEELLDLIDSNAEIEIRHQEVIMDFPYRKRFHIGQFDTLDQSTRFNGFSFLYPVDITQNKEERREIIKNKVNEFVGKDSDIDLIIEDFKSSKLLYKYLKSSNDINELKTKLEEHFYHLNEALFIYPLRIPTTNMSSGFPSRIVAFASGIENSIIIPAEKSILDGSDFDIDELHTYYKPITSDKSKMINEDLFFETIASSYFKKENIKYIIQEISYKGIVNDTNALNDEADTRRGVYSSSLINMITAREKMLVGQKMVGFKVNEQQSSLLTLAMGELNEQVILPISKEKDGILKMVDLYSSYVNLATDNGKLDGVLGRLKHDQAFIQLEIGLIGNGLGLTEKEISELSSEEYKSLLNKKLYDVYNSTFMKDVITKFKNSSSILKGGYFNSFQSLLLAAINKVKESDADYAFANEIFDALVLGTSISRLYQFNLTRGTNTSGFDAYKLYRDLSFNLGEDLSSFVNSPINKYTDVLEQTSFIKESNNDFETAVRKKINLSKFVKSNPLMYSQVRAFYFLYDSMKQSSEKHSVFTEINSFYEKERNILNYSGNTLNESKFNLMMDSAESLLITDFIKNGKFNNGKISLKIEKDSNNNIYETIEYNLSNYNDLMAFLTDFPEFVKLAKSEYKYKNNTVLNRFIDKISVKMYSDGSYETKIKNSENMDDDTFVDDYINDFMELPENVKNAFRIYGILQNGFDIKKNSLTRFMDEQIFIEYSNYRQNNVGLNISTNSSFAALMKHKDLQVSNRKGKRFGYHKSPKKHSLHYGTTYTQGNEIKVLKTYPNTFLLSDESIVSSNTYYRFNSEQERMLKNGEAFEFRSDFVIDQFRDSSSNPIEQNAEKIPSIRSNINHSKYNTFRLEKKQGYNYIVVPVSKNETITNINKEESISTNGKELNGYFDFVINNFFNEKVNHGSTLKPFMKNGMFHMGQDNQIFLTNIINKPEVLLFLNSNNRNNYYVDFMNNVQNFIGDSELFNSLVSLLGESKMTDMDVAGLILRNNSRESFRNLIVSLSNGVTKEMNTVLQKVQDGLFDSARAFIVNAQTTMINDMSSQLLNSSYVKLNELINQNKLRLIDVIQEKVNSDFVIKDDFINDGPVSPTKEAVMLKDEIELKKQDIETIKCTLINQ